MTRTLLSETVFRVAGVDYRWSDVVTWAAWTGDWPRLEQDVAEALGRTANAALLGTLPGRADLRRAGRNFRYERRLISAEDFEAWLDRWGVSSTDWEWWLRSVLTVSAEAPGVETSLGGATEIDPLLWPSAVCSGQVARWGLTLAGRVAASTTTLQVPPASPLDGPACADLQAAYEAFCAAAVAHPALEAAVYDSQLDWTRFRYQWLSFASTDAAHEGWLCLTDDGMDMHALAGLVGTPVERSELLAEDMDADFRATALSAVPGDLLGPLTLAGGPAIVRVTAKDPPTLEDPRVHDRARTVVTERAVQRIVADRVEWRHSL